MSGQPISDPLPSGRTLRIAGGFAVGIAGAALVALAANQLSMDSHPGLPYIVAVCAVIVAAWLGGRLAGATSVVLLALSIDYGYTEPFRQLSLKPFSQTLPVAAFAVIALFVVELLVRNQETVRQAASDRARLSLLHKTDEVLASSLGVESSVPELARYVVDVFADWLSVDVLEADGSLRDLTVAYRLPNWSDGVAMGPGTCPPGPVKGALAALAPDEIAAMRAPIEPGEMPLFASNSQRAQVATPLRLRSQLVAPMVATGGTRGILTMARSAARDRFVDEDVEVALEMASRISVAIDTWILYQGYEEAARRAEEDARRTAVLQGMTAAMGRADTVQEVVDSTLSEGILATGARAGAFALVDMETRRVEIAGSRGFVQDGRSYWRSFGLDDRLPLAEAIREGRPVTLRSVEDRRERYPDLAESDADRDHVLVCLPVRTGQTTLGGIAISFPEGMDELAAPMGLLQAIADQSAQALDRSITHESERTSRRRLEELSNASRVLSLSLDLDETASKIAKLAVEYLGERAVLYLARGGGVDPIRLAYRDPEKGAIVEEIMEWPRPQMETDLVRRAISTERPLTHERPAKPATGSGAGRIERMMVLPLELGRAPTGALVVTDPVAERPFGGQDIEFAEEVVRRMARAYEHARSYRERDRLALQLQESLLPPVLPQIPGLRIASLFRPAMRTFDISGDFFDVFETPTGRWAAAIGDVCGKGSEAAVVTSLVRHTLRAVSRSPSAGEALAILNEVLVREELDGRFCTSCLAILDPGPEGVDVDLAIAGHPLPRLIEPDQPSRTIGERGTLLGIVDDPTIGECRFRLADGSTLLLFTDGLLGKDEESQPEVERLEQRLRSWRPDDGTDPLQLPRAPWHEAQDDIAVLAIRATV